MNKNQEDGLRVKTNEQVAAILKRIQHGEELRIVAKESGVTLKTLYTWCQSAGIEYRKYPKNYDWSFIKKELEQEEKK